MYITYCIYNTPKGKTILTRWGTHSLQLEIRTKLTCIMHMHKQFKTPVFRFARIWISEIWTSEGPL